MKIVIFSYFFYPGEAVGGMRPYALATGLAAKGHEVHVVTAEPEAPDNHGYAVHVVRDSRVVSRIDKLLVAPDAYRPWAMEAASASFSSGLLEEADALITSGGPFSTHLVGLKARESGWRGAWIAEYRDLWSRSPYYTLGPVRRVIDSKIERRVLAAANIVVAATEMMAREIRCMSPGAVAAIYSPVTELPLRRFARESVTHKKGRCLRIAHSGYLYKGRRDVRPLLRAVAQMRRDRAISQGTLEIHFFGARDRLLAKSVKRLSLDDYVILHGELPRDELWDALGGMDALAVIRWPSPHDAPFIPGKLFEYLAFDRPVLVINAIENGEAERLVRDLGCGVLCATEDDIRRELLTLLRAKQSGRGSSVMAPRKDLRKVSMEQFILSYESCISKAVLASGRGC